MQVMLSVPMPSSVLGAMISSNSLSTSLDVFDESDFIEV